MSIFFPSRRIKKGKAEALPEQKDKETICLLTALSARAQLAEHPVEDISQLKWFSLQILPASSDEFFYKFTTQPKN